MFKFLVILGLIFSSALVQMPGDKDRMLDQTSRSQLSSSKLSLSLIDHENKCCAKEAIQQDLLPCQPDAKAVLVFSIRDVDMPTAEYLTSKVSSIPSTLSFLQLRPPIS